MEIDIYEYDDESWGIKVLGSDQLHQILHYLPVPEIVAFGMTCHRFNAVVSSDALWARICRREWGDAVVEAWPSSRRKKLSWKQLYGEMLFCSAIAWHHVIQWDVKPLGRASHSMNLVAGRTKLLLFGGGCEGGRTLSDTWVATLPNNLLGGLRWQRASSNTGANPPARFGHTCVLVDDETLVLFGGINDSGARHSDTWINKVSACSDGCSWRLLEVENTPLARGAHAGCYAGEKQIVVFGGIRNDGVRINDTWLLDLSQEPPAWCELVTPVSPPARSGHTLTWIGGQRMVLFGGRGAQFEVLNDVWMLDLGGPQPAWFQLSFFSSEAPSPRAGHSASLVFGGRILIYGGEDSRRVRKGDAWLLDPDAGAARFGGASTGSCSSRRTMRRFWKKLRVRGQAPGRRSFHEACTLSTGHGVLVFGGMIDDPSSAELVFDSELFLLQLIP